MIPGAFLRMCQIFGVTRSPMARLTPEGGLMIQLVNKTGAVSVKGSVVCTGSAVDKSCQLIVKDAPDPIGVIYNSGIADGSPVWVVVSGVADVLFWNAPTRKQLARGSVGTEAGYEAGKVISEAIPSSPFATDKHFYEIGHVLESKASPGLAKVNLHFN
jgi:hypothetical protein